MLRTQRAQRQRRQVHQPKLQHQCVLGDHRSATGAKRRNIDINSASIDRDRVFNAECAATRRIPRCNPETSRRRVGVRDFRFSMFLREGKHMRPHPVE